MQYWTDSPDAVESAHATTDPSAFVMVLIGTLATLPGGGPEPRFVITAREGAAPRDSRNDPDNHEPTHQLTVGEPVGRVYGHGF
jgi:hypothetical protein